MPPFGGKTRRPDLAGQPGAVRLLDLPERRVVLNEEKVDEASA